MTKLRAFLSSIASIIVRTGSGSSSMECCAFLLMFIR